VARAVPDWPPTVKESGTGPVWPFQSQCQHRIQSKARLGNETKLATVIAPPVYEDKLKAAPVRASLLIILTRQDESKSICLSQICSINPVRNSEVMSWSTHYQIANLRTPILSRTFIQDHCSSLLAWHADRS
jgi:hypothetical protein